ncbi:unnamed protein product [Diamesa hyperborea]
MISLKCLVLIVGICVSCFNCRDIKYETDPTEASHMELIMANIMPSVSEDHIKVLKIANGTIYGKGKAKPRKITEKLHHMNTTDYNEDEYTSTTTIHPENTSHSHIYERTGKTTESHHKTNPTKSTNFSRTKRSLTEDELGSFAEMGKVFTDSFKRFEDDAVKARTDFMKFMTTLDKLSEERDKANNHL